jgi:hypothetical protein
VFDRQNRATAMLVARCLFIFLLLPPSSSFAVVCIERTQSQLGSISKLIQFSDSQEWLVLSSQKLLLVDTNLNAKPIAGLPGDISGHAPALLRLWLGESAGTKLAKRVEQEGLLPHLVSGYDIRLIADIAGSNVDEATLPDDRVSLYRSVLTEALAGPEQTKQTEALKRIAWNLLVAGRRDLGAPEIQILGDHVVKTLQEGKARILRQMSTYLEFRHDQMRAFLAASFLVDESPNIEAMIERLADSDIWNRGRRDQEELWAFLCDLMPPMDLPTLSRSTLGRPKMSFLQAAIFGHGKDRPFVLSTDDCVA